MSSGPCKCKKSAGALRAYSKLPHGVAGRTGDDTLFAVGEETCGGHAKGPPALMPPATL